MKTNKEIVKKILNKYAAVSGDTNIFVGNVEFDFLDALDAKDEEIKNLKSIKDKFADLVYWINSEAWDVPPD